MSDEPKTGLMVKKNHYAPDRDERTQVMLFPGDTIEYGITHEVELADRTRMWVKVSSTTHVQRNETENEAATRLAGFVHEQIKNRIVQAALDAGDIGL